MADERKGGTGQEKDRLDNLMHIQKGQVQYEPESGAAQLGISLM